MRMKSLILIFIALGCGLVASIGISQVMERGGGGGAEVEMDQILIALTDVDGTAKLDATNVQLEDWPKMKIPEGAIRKVEDAVGKYAITRFYKGEPILVTKISEQPSGVTQYIPDGYRAMPVKVEEDTVMKAISPGDRVDVMVFVKRNGDEILKTAAYTILRNVRVFAINANTERAVDAKGHEATFRTVSLLVKEKHSGDLTVAARIGTIVLTLRRPDETDTEVAEAVTPLEDILDNGQAEQGSDPPAAAPATPPGNGSFLQLVQSGQQAAPAVAAPGSEWQMRIFGPNGAEQYDWSKRDALPTKSTVATVDGSAGGIAPPAAGPTTQPTTPDSGQTPETTTEPPTSGDEPPAE